MQETKRKKLEGKGWRIGTPKDFLEMSNEEEAYVNLRLKLAEGLKATTPIPRHHPGGARPDHQVQPVARCQNGGGRPSVSLICS